MDVLLLASKLPAAWLSTGLDCVCSRLLRQRHRLAADAAVKRAMLLCYGHDAYAVCSRVCAVCSLCKCALVVCMPCPGHLLSIHRVCRHTVALRLLHPCTLTNAMTAALPCVCLFVWLPLPACQTIDCACTYHTLHFGGRQPFAAI